MRYAIFSDIHNYTAALEAVLEHAETQSIDQYMCLGDIGIDACVDLVRQVEASTVFGNWEVSGWRSLLPQNQQWTLNLPPIIKQPSFWLTHAAPFWIDSIQTLQDYLADRHFKPMSHLFPYLHFESEPLWDAIGVLSEATIPVLFHGHTHRQMIWQFTADNQLKSSFSRRFSVVEGDTLIVGVGSVGHPEDGPGAAYVVYDDEAQQIEMVRVNI